MHHTVQPVDVPYGDRVVETESAPVLPQEGGRRILPVLLQRISAGSPRAAVVSRNAAIDSRTSVGTAWRSVRSTNVTRRTAAARSMCGVALRWSASTPAQERPSRSGRVPDGARSPESPGSKDRRSTREAGIRTCWRVATYRCGTVPDFHRLPLALSCVTGLGLFGSQSSRLDLGLRKQRLPPNSGPCQASAIPF